MTRSASRLFGFFLVTLVGGASTLIALPALTRQYGAEGWGAIALGESIGSGIAVLIELGWGLSGPIRVARARGRSRIRQYSTSLAAKSLAALVLVPLAFLISSTIARSYEVEAGLAAAATAASALSPVWYFVGLGSPLRILLIDSLPRAALVALAAVALNRGLPLILYPLAFCVALIISVTVSTVVVGFDWQYIGRLGVRRLVRVLKLQLVAMSARVASAAYISLPVTLVGLFAPAALPVFASAERLQRLVLTMLQIGPSFLQGWVGKGSGKKERSVRARKAFDLSLVTGAVAGISFMLAAPYVSSVLFSHEATTSFGLTVVCGLVILCTCTSRALGGIVLVVQQRIGAVARSAVAGLVVGIPAIVLLSREFGAVGALWGEVAAELVVLSVQAAAWRDVATTRK